MRISVNMPCAVCLETITSWADVNEGLQSSWAISRGDRRAQPCGHSIDEIWREWRKSMEEKVAEVTEEDVDDPVRIRLGSVTIQWQDAVFNGWRNKLAEAAGYAIGPGPYPSPLIQWGRYTDDNFFGEWDEVPYDPIMILIVHNTNGGIISHKYAQAIADRIEELCSMDTGVSMDEYGQFVGMLRISGETEEDLQFLPTDL